MRYVDGGAFYALSQGCRLYYSVLLRVKSPAQLVLFSGGYPQLLPETSPFSLSAVLKPLGRSVIACGYYMLVLHYYSSHVSSKTRGPLCRKLGHLHKIFIPCRSVVHTRSPFPVFILTAPHCSKPL